MPSEKNIQEVNTLKEKLERAKSIVFAKYHGLDANQNNRLRRRIKESGGEMYVTRNTLVKIALKEKGLDEKEANENLKGPLATFFGYEDAIAPIKAISEFAKETKIPEFEMGFIDGKFTKAEQLKILSDLPSKKELQAKVVMALKSPIRGIVNVLNANQKNLVYVLSAIADKKESS